MRDMEEYISRNELLKAVQSNVAEAHNERCGQLLEAILNAPTADVAPKSEVAREIIDIIEQRRSLNENASKGHYVYFWKGFYQGSDWAYRDIKEIIKQKYTDDKECPMCKHFAGCEQSCGGMVCDEYEVSQT